MKNKKTLNHINFLILIILLLFIHASGAIIDLNWSANPETDLLGYKIHYGLSSGSYTSILDVGNVTKYKVNNLTEGVKYYMAVSAYDRFYNESAISIETSSNAKPILNPVNILFVVASTALRIGDLKMKTRLEGFGYTLLIKTAVAVTTANAENKDLVIISSTCNANDVNTKFKDITIPVLLWEAILFDDMGMTGLVQDTDFGTISYYRDIEIINDSHPIVNGFSGITTILFEGRGIMYGVPNENADIIATIIGNPDKAALFCYDKGDIMPGMTAPAKRIGFYTDNDSASSLTVAGWTIFDNAVQWALDNDSTPGPTATPAPPTPTPTPPDTTGWVNTTIAEQTDTFTCTFDVIPLAADLDGVAGLSCGTADDYYDMACIVQFNQNGYIYARNEGNYNKDNDLIYSANTKYTIRLVVNVTAHTYNIYVTPDEGNEIVIGTDYTFRTEQTGIVSIDNHVYFSRYGIITVSGFNITGPTPTPTPIDTTGWVNNPFESQNDIFTCTFDVIPLAADLDGVAGLSLGTADYYNDMACMVQFNQNGYIFARDGGNYNKDNDLIYSANTKYTVKFEVDIPAHTYSIYVTPDGGNEIVIGTDYAFRTDQSGVASLDNLAYCSLFGIIQVNNFIISTDPSITVTASTYQDPNVPENTLDGNLITRWSADGDGEWIKYDLAEMKTLNSIDIAWFRGDQRKSFFEIKVSTDNVNFTGVYDGTSSGNTLSLETYDITDIAARYIMIVGGGNTDNNWNSINEVILNTADTQNNLAVYASGDNGNVPLNTLDNNLTTWWSDYGDGKWIEYDFGLQRELSSIDIAWFRGDLRRTFFEIQLSFDGINYTQAHDGVSSGGTKDLENYDITDTYTRYIRIIGHENTENAWCSITEVEINTSTGMLTTLEYNNENITITKDNKYIGLKKSVYNINSDKKIIFDLNADLTSNTSIKLNIYDIKGNVIYISEKINGNKIIWNILDKNNKLIQPGVYVYKLNINNNEISLKKKGIIVLAK